MKRCIQCKTGLVVRDTGRKCPRCLTTNELAYRARRKQAAVSNLMRETVWREADGKCEVCGVQVHRKNHRYDSRNTIGEVDHITPVVLGGTNDRSNLQLTCKGCNRKKDAIVRPLYVRKEVTACAI